MSASPGPTDHDEPVGAGAGFGDRLVMAVGALGPLCVGIDPSAGLLEQWGLPDDADGLARFAETCVEALAGVVPIIKPQVAFFERHGSAGFAVLERLLTSAREAGLLVIADAKRGDIDSTAAAYASAWLDPASTLAADAVTAVPYLGLGALHPMFELARRHGKGVIVVVRSSNPEGRSLQQAIAADGVSVEDGLLGAIATLNADELAAGRAATVGPFGAVVGATLAPSGFALGELRGPLLAPGLGAQGATAEDTARLFAGCLPGTVLPSVSRSVLGAGPDPVELRGAAERQRDELVAALA